jgi:hypothetical protein
MSIEIDTTSEDQFVQRLDDAIEIHIHTWLDSTLRDVKFILQQVWTALATDSPVTFYHSFLETDGVRTVRQLQSMSSATSEQNSSFKSLEEFGFEAGNWLFVTTPR